LNLPPLKNTGSQTQPGRGWPSCCPSSSGYPSMPPSRGSGDSGRQQTPKCCHKRNQGLWASISSCLRLAAEMSLALSGLMSGASNISCSCSISLMMRSTSIGLNHPAPTQSVSNGSSAAVQDEHPQGLPRIVSRPFHRMRGVITTAATGSALPTRQIALAPSPTSATSAR